MNSINHLLRSIPNMAMGARKKSITSSSISFSPLLCSQIHTSSRPTSITAICRPSSRTDRLTLLVQSKSSIPTTFNTKGLVMTPFPDWSPCLYASISNSLAPYFKYAKWPNQSSIKENLGIEKAIQVFQNCVACNTTRFSQKEMAAIRIGMINMPHFYHCDSCRSNFDKAIEEMLKNNSSQPSIDTINQVTTDKIWKIPSKL